MPESKPKITVQAKEVLTKTRNDLKRPETTYNDLQRARNNMKWPETTYSKQDTTWNDPQQVRHNLQWPEHTYNKQRKDAKRSTTSRFWDYFTIWDSRFFSLTRFPPNIWLQSFEHCFTETHGEKRASRSIITRQVSILMCIFMGYKKGRGYYFSSSL